MNPSAIVILGEQSVEIARRIQAMLPDAQLYGLANRTQAVDISYLNFGETVRNLYAANTPIIGICAAGILIRTLAPLLVDKRSEPPVIAIAEDGSAVVPLLGGLTGANALAAEIAAGLQVSAAITATGQLRFNIVLEVPPPGYRLLNPEHAKSFTSDVLAGATVKLIGGATWLCQSQLPFSEVGTHIIEVCRGDIEAQLKTGSPTHLIYIESPQGSLAIIGLGPGSAQWMSSEAKTLLQSATDVVGYQTYLELATPYLSGQQCHGSDNRVERDRARQALNLAAEGRSVVVVSSGDPGIYAMAAAVLEVLEAEANPQWDALEIQITPGISAMQAAATSVGAPLGHDFCVISLSDNLKPWSVIERRIIAAAEADFAIAFYNPASKQRTWQLSRAKEILLQWRSADTPVVLAQSVGRPGANVEITKLAQLIPEAVNMQTILLIGSSQTRTFTDAKGKEWIYTPRQYPMPESSPDGVSQLFPKVL
jgi:cobalt-precorrin 5A hydrolase / precorrin-3B C17-methyltransferase